MTIDRRQLRARKDSRMRRQVIIATILLVAVMVMLIFVRSWLEELSDDSVSNGVPTAAIEPERIDPTSETPTPVELPEEVAAATSDTATVEFAPILEQLAPVRVIVLPARLENSDPASEVFIDAVRQAMLRALRGDPAIEIMEVSPADLAAVVPPNAGPLRDDRLAFLAISREFRGSVVVEIAEQSPTDSPNWFVTLQVSLSTSDSSISGRSINRNGDPLSVTPADSLQGNDPQRLGVSFANSIARKIGQNALELLDRKLGSSRTVAPDPTSWLDEELLFMSQLRNESLNSEALAAAVGRVTQSESASTRETVWMHLRLRVYDPTLAPAMSNALLSDPDPLVRKEAALALAAYTGDGGALPALEYALSNDSSAEVRLAARMATLAYSERQAFKREILLDRSLTPAERLAPTMTFPERSTRAEFGSYDAARAEAARAYAEIVAGADDPALKLNGLLVLRASLRDAQQSGIGSLQLDPEITRVLIESAAVEDYLDTHELALSMLTELSDNPEVRAVLVAVLEREPELADRYDIAEALARPLSPAVPGR